MSDNDKHHGLPAELFSTEDEDRGNRVIWLPSHLPCVAASLCENRPLDRTSVIVGAFDDPHIETATLTFCGEHVHLDVGLGMPYASVLIAFLQAYTLALAVELSDMNLPSREQIAKANEAVFAVVAEFDGMLAQVQGLCLSFLEGWVNQHSEGTN